MTKIYPNFSSVTKIPAVVTCSFWPHWYIFRKRVFLLVIWRIAIIPFPSNLHYSLQISLLSTISYSLPKSLLTARFNSTPLKLLLTLHVKLALFFLLILYWWSVAKWLDETINQIAMKNETGINVRIMNCVGNNYIAAHNGVDVITYTNKAIIGELWCIILLVLFLPDGSL